ncbi:hypothetical protein ABPG74_001810 [Tetrahymena malaccensis]
MQKNEGIKDKSSIYNTSQKCIKSFYSNLFLYKPLIQDYLYSLSLGISFKDNKMFSVSKGECMHCSPLHIRSIKCFETNKVFDCCVKAQKFLEINYVEKGLSENQRLPEWMQVDFQKSQITIKGTPDQKSVGLSRIKIFDSKGYLLRQFDIQISDKRNLNEILSLVQHQNNNDQQKNCLNNPLSISDKIYQDNNESSPHLFLQEKYQEKQKSGEVLDEELDICSQNIKSQRFKTFSRDQGKQQKQEQNPNINL